MAEVNIVVEGMLDESVAMRLIQYVGGKPGRVLGGEGKQSLLQRLPKYNCAGNYSAWLVLIDLDQDAECAPAFRTKILPRPAPKMCFRIAVPKVEAWLLADREGFAQFLGIRCQDVPANPEAIFDPRQKVIELARKSKRKDIREDIIPRPGTNTRIGPAYASRLGEFVDSLWVPSRTPQRAPSLNRAVLCLERLIGVKQP